MNTIAKILVYTIATWFCFSLAEDENFNNAVFGRTFFNPKPQGAYQPRRMMGVMHDYYRPDYCKSWATCSFLVDYATSHNGTDIGRYLFFNNTNTMLFNTNTDPQTDVFSQNFLLGTIYKGDLTIKPKVHTTVIDSSCFIALDNFIHNTYLFIELPWCHTRWQLRKDSTTLTNSTVIPAHSLGNLTDQLAPTDSLGDAVNGQFTFFDVKEPLRFAKMDSSLNKSNLADIRISLGATFINRPDRHFGLSARFVIPTGNKPDGLYLFEPIVGNGHHVQAGFGLSAHSTLWQNCYDQEINAYLEGSLYHLFNNRQKRTFDLRTNGIGSRYLLFKKFTNNIYDGTIERGPNILTLNCTVNNDIEAQATGMFEYCYHNWIVQAGYNVWARSHDNIESIDQIPEGVYGIAGLSGTDPLTNRNRTASLTTINGTNATLLDPVNKYISSLDINKESAQHPTTFTNMVFLYGCYHWPCSIFEPYLGIGTEIELTGHRGRAFNMWHILIKGGFSLI